MEEDVLKTKEYFTIKKEVKIDGHRFLSRFTDDYDEFLHKHDFFEIVFISYGDIKHSVDGKIYNLKAGDAFLIAPEKEHSFIRKGECAHRDIMISDSLFAQACDYIDGKFYDYVRKEKFIQFSMTTAQMENFESSYFFYNESENPKVKHVYENVLCAQLLSILYANTQSVAQPTTFKSKCLTLVNEHFSEKDVLEILREELGYTQGHFCKKFKATFKMTPTDYINLKRINNAASILTLSNYTIEECCYSVGFESLPHFIKLFKQHYGTTPAKYRKAHKPTT